MRWAFLLVALLLLGCAGPSEQKGTTTTPTVTLTPSQKLADFYQGIMKPKAGYWAEWEIYAESGKESAVKYVYVDKISVDGKTAIAFELVGEIEGKKVPMQVWISEDGSALKFAVKTPQGVFCYPVSYYQSYGAERSEVERDKYSPERIEKSYRYEMTKFTTKTGKTVNAVRIFEGKNETWVSGEVPFGFVKFVSDGKTRMELADFGFGAKPEMSVEEVKNCRSFFG